MAHNISERKRRSQMAGVTPNETLAQGLKVMIVCGPCHRWASPDYGDLAARDLLGKPWTDIAKKMRCTCGGKAQSVSLSYGRQHVVELRV